jgi:diacylglycerol kinase family enzyme
MLWSMGCCAILGEDEPPFAFAVLPLGTANDFARHIGFDPSDIVPSLRGCRKRPVRNQRTLATVNGSVFVNMATGGFGTKVTAETDPNLKRVFGGAAYLFTGLTAFQNLRLRRPDRN